MAKIYVVVGVVDYEGYTILKAFNKKEKAEFLKTHYGKMNYKNQERELNAWYNDFEVIETEIE